MGTPSGRDSADRVAQIGGCGIAAADCAIANAVQPLQRFVVALNSIGTGLGLYDANERLIFCNNGYKAIYALPSKLTTSGARFRQVMDYLVAQGNYPGIKTYAQLLEKLPCYNRRVDETWIDEFTDGRVIYVARTMMPDGGWVATHEDITKQRRISEELKDQNGLLQRQERERREQNILFEAALDNMNQGLAMYDGRKQLLVANRNYRELYGLRETDVQPGTPLLQLVERAIENGLRISTSAEDYANRQMLKSDGPYAVDLEFSDGRQIHVSVQPMSGGGWVTVHQDITEQRLAEEKMAYMALHDSLTDLPNRLALMQRLESSLARVRRGQSIALMMLDLDRFKDVNDTFGHPVGDQLLCRVADRLRANVRETDVVARMGGDEFAIIESDVKTSNDTVPLAERIIAALKEPFMVDGHQAEIGVSIGIVLAPNDGVTSTELMKKADLALYKRKSAGRGGYGFFDHKIAADIKLRKQMQRALTEALAGDQLLLHYQPIFNVAEQRICCCEALLRWHHPERGLIPPSEFIPIAEELGMMVPIGEWVLRTACKTAVGWPDNVKLAVNISQTQLRPGPLRDCIVQVLSDTGLPPDRLELEVTETALLKNRQTAAQCLNELTELGVRIALDDFGTGYSSLTYLQSFPVSRIKVDRSFVQQMLEERNSEQIIRAVVGLAHNLAMDVTAEGVESAEHVDALSKLGCHDLQGFFLSKPVPARTISRMIKQRGELIDINANGATNAA